MVYHWYIYLHLPGKSSCAHFFTFRKTPRSQRPDKGLSLVTPGQWDEVYRYIYRSTDERLEFSMQM